LTVELGKDSIDLGIVVRDVDACRAFYGQTLGLPFEGELTLGTGLTMYRYKVGTTVLKLLGGAEAVPAGPSGLREQTGLRYFTITVKDLDAAVEGVRRQGVEPVTPPREARPGVRMAMFRDPDGNLVEVIETTT
jgi:catechol 2,3-dioxygenase-like lactoylglutathione lyase family enzyme